MRAGFGFRVRIVVVASTDSLSDQPRIAFFHDRQGSFRNSYGDQEASFLVRPDGYVGWRGRCWRDSGLFALLRKNNRAACFSRLSVHAVKECLYHGWAMPPAAFIPSASICINRGNSSKYLRLRF
jgi:hypothetical protein